MLGPVAAVGKALALLAAERPDAALVNTRLGDGSAGPLVAALRAAAVPAGLCTGYGAGELEPRCTACRSWPSLTTARRGRVRARAGRGLLSGRDQVALAAGAGRGHGSGRATRAGVEGSIMATMAERHLALADRHIAEAEARIDRQRALIRELAADGDATAGAEALLTTMLATLDAMHAHRATILAR